MKVLITTPQLDKMGGVANYYNILQPYISDTAEYFTACKRNGEDGLETAKRLWNDYRNFKKVLNGFDLVHLNPSLSPKAIIRDGLFLRAAKKQNKKVIVFMHGWNRDFEDKLKKRFLRLFRKYYFQADAFVVLADQFKSSLRNMGYTGPVFLETTVVDDHVLEFMDGQICNSNNGLNILYLSRVEKKKGIYETIEAYKKIKEGRENIVLTVAGDGEELQKAKEYVSINKIKDVEFVGYVRGQDKYKLLNKADCYLFPTYGEGMPLSVLEAMAFGLPVITRPVGGLKDFFENGKMGFITESLEPQVYADMIEQLIENPQLREQISKFNREYAKKRFMASKVAERLKEIYEEVLKNETRSIKFSNSAA